MDGKDGSAGSEEFWDLDAGRKDAGPSRRLSRPKIDIGTVLIELDRRGVVSSKGEPLIRRAGEMLPRGTGRPAPPAAPAAKATSYVPDSPFIRKVTFADWPCRYTFYARFREDALRQIERPVSPCEHVPFFSYLPQFSQMKEEQIAFYRFFRSRFLAGEPLPADGSYVILFLYEIINLPEIYPPEKALSLFCSLWKTYRSSCPKLDRCVGEWMIDLCLLNRLDCPFDEVAPFLQAILRTCTLKEFYLSGAGKEEAWYRALYACDCEYNFYAGKYTDESNRALFEKHIPQAFLYACRRLAQKDPRFVPREGVFQKSAQVRDAFSAALCAYDVKKKIEVEYLAYSHSAGMRPLVTDMVKYAENCLRRRIGIRAKLSTLFLDAQMKAAIDAYYEEAFPLPSPAEKNASRAKAPEKSEFEELYMPREKGISLSSALSIEEKGWKGAEEMVSDFESFRESREETAKKEEKKKKAASNPTPQQARKQAEDESILLVRRALRLILSGDEEGLASLAEEGLMMKDTLIECVNEYCYDLIGDTALSSENGKTVVLPEYVEEVKACLTD